MVRREQRYTPTAQVGPAESNALKYHWGITAHILASLNAIIGLVEIAQMERSVCKFQNLWIGNFSLSTEHALGLPYI